jgi:hypothetical protein
MRRSLILELVRDRRSNRHAILRTPRRLRAFGWLARDLLFYHGIPETEGNADGE